MNVHTGNIHAGIVASALLLACGNETISNRLDPSPRSEGQPGEPPKKRLASQGTVPTARPAAKDSPGDQLADHRCANRVRNGHVAIHDERELAALRGVTRIQGDFELHDSHPFARVELACLERVDGSLHVRGRPGIAKPEPAILPRGPSRGLSRLHHVGGNLSLVGIETEIDTKSLARLRVIGQTLTLRNLDRLETLEGLSGLNRLGGLVLDRLPALRTLHGLHNLRAIESGPLCLSELPRLRELDGLSALVEVRGAVSLEDLGHLQSIAGLANLGEIGGGLRIRDSPRLTSVEGLDGVITIGRRSRGGATSCVRWSQADLAEPRSRPNLARDPDVDLGLELSRVGLVDLHGMAALETIRGSLIIQDNARLANLDALGPIRVEGPRLELERNPLLDPCSKLHFLQRLARGTRAKGRKATIAHARRRCASARRSG